MLLKFLRKFALFNTILGSLFLIIFLALTKFDVLPFIQNNMGPIGKTIAQFIVVNELEYTVNSSLIIALSNFILYMLSSTPTFDFSVRNSNLKSDFSELPLATSSNYSHVPKSFYFHVKVDYKNSLSYWIYSLCGGVVLEVTYPNWIDATLDSKFWNTSQFINNNTPGVIIIDVYNALPKTKLENYSGEIYSKIDLITNLNLTGFDEGYIDVSLKPKSNNLIARFFANIFIILFYSVSYDTHKIKTCS